MDLTNAGLNSYESKVYSSLVELGISTAAKISSHSGVPNGKIYNVLYELEHKGFIEIVPEKTKKFQARNPQIIIDTINKKKLELENTLKEVSNLKSIYEDKPKQPVTIVQGKGNFHRVIKEQPIPKKYQKIIRYETTPIRYWWTAEKELIKKGVDIKSLVRFDDETKENVLEYSKHQKNLKVLENEGVAISIVDDKFMFIAMIKSNTTLIIRDEPTIRLLKLMFDKTYDNSKEIKFNK